MQCFQLKVNLFAVRLAVSSRVSTTIEQLNDNLAPEGQYCSTYSQMKRRK